MLIAGRPAAGALPMIDRTHSQVRGHGFRKRVRRGDVLRW